MSQGTHDWIPAVARSLQEALGHSLKIVKKTENSSFLFIP